jgi:hypothetical protein
LISPGLPAESLRVDLRPSRLLAVALILVHALALCAVWASLSGWPRYLAGAAVLASLARTLQSGWRQVAALELREDGRASWKTRQGTWQEGALGRSHFVSPLLVVVDLEEGTGRPQRLVVPADSAAADDFRRLRVWLRWQRGPRRAGME